MLLIAAYLPAQQHTEKIRKDLILPSGEAAFLIVNNINGGVEVEAYDGSGIQLEVTKTISGSNIERGKEEVDLGIFQRGNTIVLYMDAPCHRGDLSGISNEELWEEWKMFWKDDCKWEPEYEYELDYRIRVPRQTDMRLSTVNKGDIRVAGVSGRIKANNVNGAITLDNIEGRVEAHTINGDLDVWYSSNPVADSRYYTLNGNINAHYHPGLSADLYFKSFNGEFYTDLDKVQLLPMKLKKEPVSGKRGVSMKIGGEKGIRAGSGGVDLKFETFNGDVYIHEQQ